MDEPKQFIGAYDLRSGITIFPSHDRAINLVLTDLVQKIPARCALLTDVSGQVVSFCGERGALDLVALGSLVAGDLAASQAIARLTAEYEDCQIVLREGQQNNTFISEAGRHLVLFVQVPADVPLGWARMLVIEAAHRLAGILSAPLEATEVAPRLSEVGQDGLTDLFREALDNMWSG